MHMFLKLWVAVNSLFIRQLKYFKQLAFTCLVKYQVFFAHLWIFIFFFFRFIYKYFTINSHTEKIYEWRLKRKQSIDFIKEIK